MTWVGVSGKIVDQKARRWQEKGVWIPQCYLFEFGIWKTQLQLVFVC